MQTLLNQLRASLSPSPDAASVAALRARILREEGEEILALYDDDPAALLAILDEAPPASGLFADAIAEHAGGFDIADGVLAALGIPASVPVARAVEHGAGPAPEAPSLWPIADAVAAFAGTVDVRDDVDGALGVLPEGWPAGLLDGELKGPVRAAAAAKLAADRAVAKLVTRHADVGRLVREAAREGVGDAPVVWPAVAQQIGVADPEGVPGWDESLLGLAVRAGAGEVDVAGAVMSEIARTAPVSAAPELPEPANEVAPDWVTLGGLMGVAAALLFAVLPWVQPAAVIEIPGRHASEVIQVAGMGEVNVEEISSSDSVSVFVELPVGDDMPLIISVDEGVTL